jgi:hypothetical protein
MSLPELPGPCKRVSKVWVILILAPLGLLLTITGLALVLAGLNTPEIQLADAFRDFDNTQCRIFNFTALVTPDPTGKFPNSTAFVAAAGVFAINALLPENRAIVWAAVPYRESQFYENRTSAIQATFGSLAINQTVPCAVPPQIELWGDRLIWYRSLAQPPLIPPENLRRLPVVFDFDRTKTDPTHAPFNELVIGGAVAICIGLVMLASLLILVDCKRANR